MPTKAINREREYLLQAQEDPSANLERSHTTPLPKLQLLIACFVRVTEPIAFMACFPYINQMLLDTGVVDDPRKTGFYAGLVSTSQPWLGGWLIWHYGFWLRLKACLPLLNYWRFFNGEPLVIDGGESLYYWSFVALFVRPLLHGIWWGLRRDVLERRCLQSSLALPRRFRWWSWQGWSMG